MSSSRLSNPRSSLRARLTGLSLRTRLIAAVLVLLAVVCGVIGVVTTVAMRGFLVDRLDAQLAAAANRSSRAGAEGHDYGWPPGSRPGPQFLLAPGQGEGTLGARVVSGTVTEAAVLDASGEPQGLNAS